jgi:hypothetical protein
MTSRAVVLASLLTLALAGCGGGGGTTPSTGSQAKGGSPSGGSPSVPSGSIRFVIPSKGTTGSSSSRGTTYVSPSSAAIKVTVNSINGDTSIPTSIPNPQITNLTVGGACAVNAGVETCTVPIPVPTGSVSYTFNLYDGANATGNELATGTDTLTNVAGTNAPATVALSGIVTQLHVTPAESLALDTPGDVLLAISPEDADGYAITGTAVYANGSLTVTDNDTSGTTGLSLGAPSATSIGTAFESVNVTSGANDVIYLNYNGQPSSDPNFTISSQFSSPTPINGTAVAVTLTSFSQTSPPTSYTGGATVGFPAAGGFSATMNLGVPVSAGGGTVTTTTTAAAPTEGAPTSFMRKAAAAVRHTKSVNGASVLAYFEVTFSNLYIFPSQPPTFAVTLPANIVDPTATYYIAFYDPVTATWNDTYLGPVSASGDTLTFTTGSTAPFFFAAGQEYDFALLDLPDASTPPSGTGATAPTTVNVTGTTLCNTSSGCAPSDDDYGQQALFFDSASQTEAFGISETGVSNFLVAQLPTGNLSPQTECVTTPVATAAGTSTTIAGTVTAPSGSVNATSTSTTGICEVLVIGDELAGSTFWYSNTSASIGLTGKNRRQ